MFSRKKVDWMQKLQFGISGKLKMKLSMKVKGRSSWSCESKEKLILSECLPWGSLKEDNYFDD